MGKFSDKFLDAFKINQEDDDYEDDYEYEDDFMDDEEFYDEEEFEEPAPKKKEKFFEEKPKAAPKPVKPVAPRANNNKLSQHEVCVFKPSSIEDSREITETLLAGKAVIINFEGLHVEISQRIIDFISGSCYALDGNLQKISNYIFIATPDSIDISGDFQDLLGGDDSSFDITGFKSPLL